MFVLMFVFVFLSFYLFLMTKLTWDNIWGYEKGDPRHDDKKTGGERPPYRHNNFAFLLLKKRVIEWLKRQDDQNVQARLAAAQMRQEAQKERAGIMVITI